MEPIFKSLENYNEDNDIIQITNNLYEGYCSKAGIQHWLLVLIKLLLTLLPHLQIGLICCIAKNDPELSTHPKLLAIYGKDAKSGQVKEQSFLTVHIEPDYLKKQLWPYYVLVEK